ncbi:energy transducer TonB [Algoriphagus sp. AGSA1]|uniref:energy transducer TonB n=1 Tax=Algoriphagus sp. AGSA1 TaxID=2907213 RepID=UPI001F162171|nr:energy transducer TonB [Algoriphagus sp. AGSA1]MCE7058078.1 energy transducer TonB [Algoriphagus sp. AGSA1]
MLIITKIVFFLLMVVGCAAQEVPAEFIGGREKLDEFVKENMKWPFKRMDYKGIVYIKCTINENGEILSPKVEKGLCEKCDNEALRLVKTMPNWKPSKKNGENISSEVIIPIDFSLYDNI